MVNWISSWAQGIVIAVIISTIIEMILPNGNIKKYVKTVIGVYIVFAINYIFYGLIRSIGSLPYAGCGFIWDK